MVPTDLQPLQSWVVAIPIIAAAISGYLQNKGQKNAQKQAMNWSNSKTAAAGYPLSDQALSHSAANFFPGLLPKGMATSGWGQGSNAPAPKKKPMVDTHRMSEWWKRNVGHKKKDVQPTTPIPARAEGGPVAGGQPYVVGEKGPEVVVPQAPGTVVPNPNPEPAPAPTPAPAPKTDQTVAPGVAPTLPGARKADPSAATPGGLPSEQPTPAPLAAPPVPGGTAPNANLSQTSSSIIPEAPTAGALAVQSMMNYFTDPGKISSVAYEREQEQANQGLNFATRALGGTLSSVGINPNSGYGQMLGQSAALNAMKLKNEANRDFTMASEQMRRTDINTATQTYIQFLQTIFGLGAAQSGAVTNSSSNVNIPFPNMNEGAANAAGIAGQTLGDYFANKDQKTPPAAGSTAGSSGVGPHAAA